MALNCQLYLSPTLSIDIALIITQLLIQSRALIITFLCHGGFILVLYSESRMLAIDHS
jgi:hypothetical protein